MNKNIKKKKLEVINMENDEMREEILEETEVVGENKWSLKKKLLVGGGILAGLVLGAVALGSRKSANNDNEDEDFDNDEMEETETAETTEIPENVEE